MTISLGKMMKLLRDKTNSLGFTLLEISAAILIVGILGSIGAFRYQNYLRKAKSTEALEGVNQLYMATISYHMSQDDKLLRLDEKDLERAKSYKFPQIITRSEHSNKWFVPPPGERTLLICFDPTSGKTKKWTPYVSCQEIGFSISDPSFYVYRVRPDPYFKDRPQESRARTKEETFRVEALGDLDGDGIYSEFSRPGGIDRQGKLYQTEGVFRSQPYE